MTQEEQTLELLRQHPEGITTRDFRALYYIMNPGEPVRHLRAKGYDIAVEHPFENKKISTYKLHEKPQGVLF